MSTTESSATDDEDDEEFGESPKPNKGEDNVPSKMTTKDQVTIQDKSLTFQEASQCLNTLGKDESCTRYAYLRLSAADRKLTNVQVILNFRHLLFVDVSGNYLTLGALHVLEGLPFIIQLHAQRNFVESAALRPMAYLQELSLSRNQIKETSGINQPSLEYLDLNYNQIYQAEFEKNEDECLPQLKELEMRGNFLYEFGGKFPESVQKLFLAENRIQNIIYEDTWRLSQLQVLHLRNNMIRKLDGFQRVFFVVPTKNEGISESMKNTDDADEETKPIASAPFANLKYLNLRQNKINKLRQFRKLKQLPKLETLIISQNPVAGKASRRGADEEDDDDEELEGEDKDKIDPNRVALLVLLPNLMRINKDPVTYMEREQARLQFDEKMREIMSEDSSGDEMEALSTTNTDFLTDMAEG